MATCVVSGKIVGTDGGEIEGATVTARVVSPVFSGTTLIVPEETSVDTNATGDFSMTLQASVSVVFTVEFPPNTTDSLMQSIYAGNVPATPTANFSAVIVSE